MKVELKPTVLFPEVPEFVPASDRNYVTLTQRVQRLLAVCYASRCYLLWANAFPGEVQFMDAIRMSECYAELKRPKKADTLKLYAALARLKYAPRSEPGPEWAAAEAAAATTWPNAWSVILATSRDAVGAAWGAGGKLAAACNNEDTAQSRLFTLAIPIAGWSDSWVTEASQGLAHAIYDDRAYDRLPILADAIQDAGCEHPWLLRYMRDERAVHCSFRGMWFLDRLTGRAK